MSIMLGGVLGETAGIIYRCITENRTAMTDRTIH